MKKALLIATILGGGTPVMSVSPSTWDFGSTPVGTPVTKEFTILNSGNAALVITLPITIVGSGFSVTSQPAVTSLAPGASTTFTVQATASSVATFNANISITNNSAENPKLVAITANVTIITSGLVYWYKSNDLSTLWQDSARTTPAAANADVIGARDDKSGNGYHLLQATTSNKMTLRTNVQNAKSCVRSDGVNDYLVKSFGATYTQPNTLFAAMNFKSAAFDIAMDGVGAANRTIVTSTSSQVTARAGVSLHYNQTLPTGAMLLNILYKGATSNINVNNVDKITGDAGTDALVGLTLGAGYYLGEFAEVDYFEEIMYNRELTVQETAYMRAYLNAEWGLY